MTTVTDIAHQLIDPVTEGADDILALACALAERARQLGFVLTIETVSRTDAPAQGNFNLMVDLRLRRPRQRPHVVMVPTFSPEVLEQFADQLVVRHDDDVRRAEKILEDNDAAVGRRQFWGFRAKGGFR